MKTLILCLTVVFSASIASAAAPAVPCDFAVLKTLIPTKAAKPVCLEEYFHERNLGQNSLSSDADYIFQDMQYMQFDDWMLFTVPSQEPMGEAGRTELVRQMYKTYTQSLRGLFGACRLNLYNGDKLLSVDDFKVVKREGDKAEQGQPGTRIVLNDEIVASPRWELICKGATGEEAIEKRGNYFYIFFDVYENQGDKGLKGHFAKFLLSFRKGLE